MNLLDALASLNVRAFLATIRRGEGTSDEAGYHRMFGGKQFDSLADHPRQVQTCKLRGGTLSSTAAGAYQFLSKTWDGLVAKYGFSDFSAHNQDLAAIALIQGRGALEDVIAGRFATAVAKCNREWASLPGSPYGQPTSTLDDARACYLLNGGEEVQDTPAPAPQPLLPSYPPSTITEPAMPPFLLAALPSLLSAVPKLLKTFSDDGTTVPERNEKAVTIAMDVAMKALGASNEQDLAARLTDPAAAAVARDAVDASWSQITDASGIEAAREADAEFVAHGASPWHSPSFLIALLLVPVVYAIVLAVIGVIGQPFSEDVRAAIANGVIGLVLGGMIGYYFGQTTSRNRTAPPPPGA